MARKKKAPAPENAMLTGSEEWGEGLARPFDEAKSKTEKGKKPRAAKKTKPKASSKTSRPADAPEQLEGEALKEWIRITGELTALKRLNSADRAIMILHCETFAIYFAATQMVMRYGSVVRWPNGIPGPAPHYKVQRECAGILRGTLRDLGLTPAARDFDAKESDEDAGDLTF